VDERTVPLKEAVSTYLFNSQLVSPGNARGGMILVAPSECERSATVRKYLARLVGRKTSPIMQVQYVNLRQSMQNGGGPACLRLRVVLTEGQILRAHPGVFLSDALHQRLIQWVEKNYREQLDPRDLADPKLLTESRTALDELTRILHLGSLYDFQRA
jgi:succinylarginine dihydrolase